MAERFANVSEEMIHLSFSIFHLSFSIAYGCLATLMTKWKMENDKWKIICYQK